MLTAGSSSIKFGVFDVAGGTPVERCSGIVEEVGSDHSRLKLVVDGEVEATAFFSGNIDNPAVPVAAGASSSCFLPFFVVATGMYGGACPHMPDHPGKESFNGEVLLVEDNDYNVDVARMMLEHMGHSVTVATNGAEAVALALSSRPCELHALELSHCGVTGRAGWSAGPGRSGGCRT